MQNIPQQVGVGSVKRKRLPIWVLLLVLSSCLILAWQGATQYVAYQYAYHASLGEPVYGVFYWPWSFMIWSWRWGDVHQTLFQWAYVIALSGVAGSFVIYFLLTLMTQRKTYSLNALHGTAHWARSEEIEAAGLLPPKESAGEAVFVGGYLDGKRLRYLRHAGPEHVAIVAPSRSGKGVALIIPTLLTWLKSVVVYDMKGELWHHSAGWRKQAGAVCLRFDPTDSSGEATAFNPLDEIRLGEPREVADTQNVATILCDPDGAGLESGGTEGHFRRIAQAFLVGVILHVLYKAQAQGRRATLPDVALTISNPSGTVDDLLMEMLHTPHRAGESHPTVAQAAMEMMNRESRERSGAVSTAISFLTLYRDPIVANNVSRSDFRVLDLMDPAQPVSLYLVVPPSDRDRVRPLVRLLITLIVRRLTEKMEWHQDKKAPRQRLLLMLDEFANLGKLEVMEESLAYLAGYGVRAFLVLQDIQQLQKAYGRDETVLSHCHIRSAFAPNKLETAEWLSKSTGISTVVKENISTSGGRYSLMLDKVNTSYSEHQRYLLTADECMRLPAATKDASDRIVSPGDMLVMVAGEPPIYGKQPLYFLDPALLKRAQVPPPRPDRLIDSRTQEGPYAEIEAALSL